MYFILRFFYLTVFMFIALPTFFLSFIAVIAQNETTASMLDTSPRTNDTTSAITNNGSTPMLFEVTSQSGDIKTSNQSLFKAKIAWTPNAIGSENTFDIKFVNSSSGEELQNVLYDIMLFNKGNLLSESHRTSQQEASQKYVFPEQGFYILKIDNIGNTTARIDLPIQVVPEFEGAGPTAVLIAGLFGMVLYLAHRVTRRSPSK